MGNYIYKTAKFKVKNADDGERTIEGYGSFFGNLDSDNDVIMKGAFNRTIKSEGPEGRDMIKLCAQHDMSRPVAKMLSLEETNEGLYIKAKFGTHTDGEDYYRMAKEGIINEFSVGFVAKQRDDNEEGGHNIKEIKLYEVSMVTIAANDKAVVTDVKSADPVKLAQQVQDKELAFKLEKEILKLQSQETSTPPVSDVAVKEETLDSEVKTDWFDTMFT